MTVINIQKLMECRRLITHADCADGTASAMIIAAALPEIEVLFMHYGSKAHLDLKAKHGDIWCDFTPHRTTLDEHVAAESIVLDHHRGAADIVERFRFGVFADEDLEPGVSGALLAFKWVYEPLFGGFISPDGNDEGSPYPRSHLNKARHFATVAGVRDTWQRGSELWEESCAQQAVLMFFGNDMPLCPNPFLLPDEMMLGVTLCVMKQKAAEKLARSAYRMGKALVIADYALTSDTAEAVRLLDLPEHRTAEVLVGFMHQATPDGVELTFSLRALRDDVNVLEIAKENGGGGHTRAAGFKVPMKVADGLDHLLCPLRRLRLAWEGAWT